MKALVLVVTALLFVAQAAQAIITFTQLDDDVFVVSHRVKAGFGLRGKAMKLAYTKTASLCIAAGFSHMRILEQESETGQLDDAANASIRAQFYLADGDDRVGCERNSESEYVQQASLKLAKRGYQTRHPEPPAKVAGVAEVAEVAEMAQTADETAEATSSSAVKPKGSSCAIEQIAAMARAGLSDEQIKAACTQ